MTKRDGGTKRTKSGTTTSASPATKVAAAARGGVQGRSGGMVDAPGKKHRQPLPADPGASIADSQAAKMRTAMTMEKTRKHRGRG